MNSDYNKNNYLKINNIQKILDVYSDDEYKVIEAYHTPDTIMITLQPEGRKPVTAIIDRTSVTPNPFGSPTWEATYHNLLIPFRWVAFLDESDFQSPTGLAAKLYGRLPPEQ